MGNGIAAVNGIDIWYDEIGRAADPLYLMIAGSVGQAVAIDLTLCEMLAERGYRVVRFDQRDTGKSTKLPEPNYTAGDVADDAAALARHLGASEAHLFGVSAGGAFAMLTTVRHPTLVRSLVTLMSTHVNSRDPKYSTPRHEAAKEFQKTPHPDDADGKVARIVTAFRDYYSGPRYAVNEEYVARYARSMVDREGRVGDSPRLVAALTAMRPLVGVEDIRAPTLVIHGTDDPLVNIRAGVETVRAIPGARFMAVEGMGHDMLSPAFFPMLVDALDTHACTSPPVWLRAGHDVAPAGGVALRMF